MGKYERQARRIEASAYYLVTYIENGRECVSAVHWRDIAKFRSEHEIISIVA